MSFRLSSKYKKKITDQFRIKRKNKSAVRDYKSVKGFTDGGIHVLIPGKANYMYGETCLNQSYMCI